MVKIKYCILVRNHEAKIMVERRGDISCFKHMTGVTILFYFRRSVAVFIEVQRQVLPIKLVGLARI